MGTHRGTDGRCSQQLWRRWRRASTCSSISAGSSPSATAPIRCAISIFGYGQGDFAKTGDFEFAKAKFDDSKWRTLNLPHDWAVELPFVHDDEQMSHGYKPLGRRYPETSVGWYRREFDVPASDQGKRVSVEFDGAFRDVLVFVNGCFVGRNNNGYAPFHFDITDFLELGQRPTTSWRALTQALAMDGSMKAQESIAMCGSRRPMHYI